MDLMKYITENALILMPVLYVVGGFLKKTPKVADWIIPWVLLVIGIAGGLCFAGVNAGGVVQGVLVTGATVLGNQLYKQTMYKD